jgi:hypothetical protein
MEDWMAEDEEGGVVAGIFADEEHAARAVERLADAGFHAPRDLSVIASHHREHQAVPVVDEPEVMHGGAIGGTLGAALAAAGAVLTGLTAGPLSMVAAGPVVAALEAALAGGAVGWAVGALEGLGIWKEEAEFHATHIHEGVVWVGVHAEGERAEDARRILTEAGAKHFMD